MPKIRMPKIRMPSSTVRIGVYGTLRRGYYNHQSFGLNRLPILYAGFVPGIKMFGCALQNYPSAVLVTDESSSRYQAYIEVYDVPVRTYNSIASLELSFGYKISKVALKDLGDVALFTKDESGFNPRTCTVIRNWTGWTPHQFEIYGRNTIDHDCAHNVHGEATTDTRVYHKPLPRITV